VVERQLVLQLADGAAKHEHLLRERVLQRGDVRQHLLLDVAALEREHVVLEDRPLGSQPDAGDAAVGRVGGGNQAGVVPGREPAIDLAACQDQPAAGCRGRDGEPEPGPAPRGECEQERHESGAAAGGRHREGLRAEMKGQGCQAAGGREAGALDAVGAPKVSALGEGPGRRPAEGHAQGDGGRQRGREKDAELEVDGQVRARDGAKPATAAADADHGQGQQRRDSHQDRREPAGIGRPPRRRKGRPRSRPEHPRRQREEIDQLDAVERDVQLAQQDDLAEQGEDADQDERKGH